MLWSIFMPIPILSFLHTQFAVNALPCLNQSIWKKEVIDP